MVVICAPLKIVWEFNQDLGKIAEYHPRVNKVLGQHAQNGDQNNRTQPPENSSDDDAQQVKHHKRGGYKEFEQ